MPNPSKMVVCAASLAFLAGAMAAPAAAGPKRTASPAAEAASVAYTRILSTRYKYLNQPAVNPPLPGSLPAGSFQPIAPLSLNFSCPQAAGCGLEVDASIDVRSMGPADGDLNLCTFVDGVGVNCRWQRLPAGYHHNAAVDTFVAVSAGAHSVQVKGRLYGGVFWEVSQGTARYTLLAP